MYGGYWLPSGSPRFIIVSFFGHDRWREREREKEEARRRRKKEEEEEYGVFFTDRGLPWFLCSIFIVSRSFVRSFVRFVRGQRSGVCIYHSPYISPFLIRRAYNPCSNTVDIIIEIEVWSAKCTTFRLCLSRRATSHVCVVFSLSLSLSLGFFYIFLSLDGSCFNNAHGMTFVFRWNFHRTICINYSSSELGRCAFVSSVTCCPVVAAERPKVQKGCVCVFGSWLLLLLVFYCIVPVEIFSPWEIRVAFPGESLVKSRCPTWIHSQPRRRGQYFCV